MPRTAAHRRRPRHRGEGAGASPAYRSARFALLCTRRSRRTGVFRSTSASAGCRLPDEADYAALVRQHTTTGQIQRIRARARREPGAAFDIRAFHDLVLGGGALPMAVLDEVVTGWTAELSAR